MKKALVVLLTLCMLFSMVACAQPAAEPAAAAPAATEAPAAEPAATEAPAAERRYLQAQRQGDKED